MAGPRIAVVGAGAIGCSIGASLAKAGHDAVLIDQWPAHVEAMKADGLRVVLPDEEYRVPVSAYHLCEVHTLNRHFDLVLLAVKSYDTRWTAELIRPYLKADGVLVGVQNGMNEEALIPIIGYQRLIGCSFEISAEVFTPGVVQRNTPPERAWIGLGELHGRITPRLRALESLLGCAGKITLTTNIHGAKWAKLVNSSMILAPFGMLGLQSWQAVEIPEVFKLCIRLGRETLAVGTALGYEIEPIFGLTAQDFMGSADDTVEKLLMTIVRHHGESARKVRGVVLQDHLKGRYTETDFLSGLVVRKGKEAGVPTPANEAVTAINALIREGALTPQRSNLALVERHIRGELRAS
jgi:2-dehydropantoate 2-reductase